MLQELRKAKGLSQSQLANATGISYRSIQQWEIGARNINNASVTNIVKLANALDCRITELLTDEDLIKQCEKVTL